MRWQKEDEILVKNKHNSQQILSAAKELVDGESVYAIDWRLAYAGITSYSTEASWRIIANAFMFLRHLEEKYEHSNNPLSFHLETDHLWRNDL